MSVRWPAEWEPHEATWITWPWDADVWGDAHAAAVDAMAEAAAALTHGEHVIVSVPDEATGAAATRAIARAGGKPKRVVVQQIPSDDAWVRDHGPTVVVDAATGARKAVDWNFNAWGGKFPHARDNRVAEALAAAASLDHVRAPLVFEGGAIETDGAGTVLTTRSVALTDTRNPGASEGTVEATLRELLGAREVVWLDGGMHCDDTDGHVDTLARFVSPTTLAVHVMADRNHPDAAGLEANRARLQALGRWRVVPLPAPSLRAADGSWLPASYANFYIANGRVLVPTYDADEDMGALIALAGLFRGRDIVPIPSRALVRQGGAIHCATQQLPKAPLAAK